MEIISPGTVRTDRVTKFSEYAEVGIEHYWIVDLNEPISLTTFRLVGEDYEDFGEHTGKTVLDLFGVPITIDLGALAAKRAAEA